MTQFYSELKKELESLKGKDVKRFILKEDRINATIEDLKNAIVDSLILPENTTHSNKVEAFKYSIDLYIKNTKLLRDKYYSKVLKRGKINGEIKKLLVPVQKKFREWNQEDQKEYISWFSQLVLSMFYKEVREYSLNKLQRKYISTNLLKINGIEELAKHLGTASYKIMLTSFINTIKSEQPEIYILLKEEFTAIKEAYNVIHANIQDRTADGVLLSMYLEVRKDENGFKTKYHSPLLELPKKFIPQFENKIKQIEDEQEKAKAEKPNKKKSA